MLRVILVLSALIGTGCTFDLERSLDDGDIRARVMLRTDVGLVPVAGATMSLDGTRLQTTSDATGQVVLRRVPPGLHTLRLSKRGEGASPDAALVVKGVQLDPKGGVASGRDLGELVLQRVGAIEGRVVRDGQPAAHATISIGDHGTVFTDQEGRFRVEQLFPDTYPLGVETSPGDGSLVFGMKEVSVVGEQATNVEIELSTLEVLQPGVVSGVANYLDGSSPTDISVKLLGVGRHAVIDLGHANEAGLYGSVEPVRPGIYTLWARGLEGSSILLEPIVVNGPVEVPAVFLSRAADLSDLDGDGVENDADNCADFPNASQTDRDGDELGDACDDDLDQDGIPNPIDRSLELVSGDAQRATPEAVFAAPLRARVLDAWLEPVAGATVLVDRSGPVLTSAHTLISDALGFVEVALTARELSAEATVTLQVENAEPLVFRVFVDPGPTDRFVVTGYPQDMKATVPQTMSLRAVDAHGNTTPDFIGAVNIVLTQPDPPELEAVVFSPADLGMQTVTLAFTAEGTFAIEVAAAEDPALVGSQTNIRVRAAPLCGDGEVDAFTNETCDDGNAQTEPCDYGASCTVCGATCQVTAGVFVGCGDGRLQFAQGEECDDGNEDDTDDCTTSCQDDRCGDGIVQPASGELCDDGNDDEHDGCTSLCRPPLCGDGIVHAEEACDDGNQDDTDGCTRTCELPRCGDGFVQIGAGEDCEGTTNCVDCRHPTCNGVTVYASSDRTPNIVVTNTDDDGPGSLRDALAGAVTGQVIGFDPSLAGGTITLASELVPAANVVIAATPGSITLDGDGLVRIFRVPTGITLRLVGLTLTRGTRSNSQSGGCLDVSGTLTATHTTISSCFISDGANSGQGGGAAVVRTGGSLTLSHSTVANSRSQYRTGTAGILTVGTLNTCWTTFSGNASSNGDNNPGAIMVAGGTTTVLSSSFVSNTSASGGGGAIYAFGTATLVVRDSTFVGNRSNYFGGAIAARSSIPAIIERCTIINNTAPSAQYSPIAGESGGGILGTVQLSSSLVVGNTGAGGVPDDIAGTITSDGHNVVGVSTNNTGLVATDQSGTRTAPLPGLNAAYADYGGPTQTISLLPGSPAFDMASTASAAFPDQRGRSRNVNGLPDVGAIEASLPGAAAPVVSRLTSRRFDLTVTMDPGNTAATVVFDYAPSPDFIVGRRTTPEQHAVANAGTVTLSTRVRGLTPLTTWYVRARVTNEDGTVTSETTSVQTPADP